MIIESFQEFQNELLLEEFININIDGIKKKLKNMIGKNRIKINTKDIKNIINKLGLKKGMNLKQIYSKLKKGDVEEIVNNIASQAKGGIDSKDSEIVSTTESYLKIGEFFQKNKWAKYLFVAFIMLTIFSANSLANVNQEFADDGISIELDGSDDGNEVEPILKGVQEVEKDGDTYKIKVKVDPDSRNITEKAKSIACQEALQQEGQGNTQNQTGAFNKIQQTSINRTTGEVTFDIEVKNTIKSDIEKPSTNNQERQSTSKSDYLESTFGDEDI